MTYNVNRSSNTPIIALDLDGVCSKTRYGFIKEISNIYNLNISKDRLYNRRLRIPQISENYSEAVLKIINSDPSVYSRMNPIKGSALASRTLNRSYKIKIVSNRFSKEWLDPETRQEVFEHTRKWLDSNDFSYDEVVNPIEGDKSDIPADVFIDDTPEVIRSIDDEVLKITYIRPHNINHIPYNCWNAAKYAHKCAEDLVQNPQKQWSLITEYLREYSTKL